MNRYRNTGVALLAGALLLAGFAGQALALTNACTTISNQASLTYSTLAGPVTISSDDPSTGAVGDATTFDVASLVNLTNIATNTPQVIPSQTDRVLTFQIQNIGNEDARYQLNLYDRNGATVGANTDNFSMTNVRVYSDTDNNYAAGGTLVQISAAEAAQDGSNLGLAPNPALETAVVAPAGTIYIHVVADVPAGATNGQKDLFTLVAKAYHDTNDEAGSGHGTAGGWVESTNGAANNACGIAVVLGDTTESTSSDGNDVLADTLDSTTPDGDEPATGYFWVQTASISVTKAQTTLWDPINFDGVDAKPIPGAYVTYTLTITNNGAASATLSDIADDLQDTVLALDPDFFDGSDSTPADGPYTNLAAGRSVKIDHGGGSTRADSYGTEADADNDGVTYSGGLGGTLTVYFTDPAANGTVMPAGGGYAEGELKAGETVAISFNVIIQ